MQDLRGTPLSLPKRRELFASRLERFFQAAGEEGFVCPLEPTLRCQQRPLAAASALMRSKKMPQRLVFENYDARLVGGGAEASHAEPYRIAFMYKMGDDLRQDNLVLNLLQVGPNYVLNLF